MKKSKDNKILKGKEILKNKIKERELNLLKKQASKIEENKVNAKNNKKGKRRNLKFFLILLIVLIILFIACFYTFIDTEEIVKRNKYKSNLNELESELKAIIKERRKENPNYDISLLDSAIFINDDEDAELSYVIMDTLKDLKNEYTVDSIAIRDGKLVYIGYDEKFMKIAESKKIAVDYMLLSNIFMYGEDLIVDEETGTIEDYYGDNKIIYIPQYVNGIEIKNIGKDSFEGKNIEVVIVAEGIENIYENSFANNNIFYLKLPSTLKEIGNKAFYKNDINQLIIEEGTEQIGKLAFACNKLEKIEIKSTNLKLGAGCFNQNYIKEKDAYFYNSLLDNDKYELISYAGNSNSIKIEEGVIKIGKDAFSKIKVGNNNEYNYIKNISFPNSLKIIDDNAFQNNDITNLVIPDSVEYIGSNAFENNKISNLKINNMNEIYLFRECFNGNLLSDDKSFIITNKTLTNSILNIYYYNNNLVYSSSENTNVEEMLPLAYRTKEERTLVSYAGKNREKVLIPYSVINIESFAFADLGIKEIVFSDSIEKIGMKAFAGNKLQKLQLPASLNEIKYDAFTNNDIKEIIIKGKNEMPEGFHESLSNVTTNIIYE